MSKEIVPEFEQRGASTSLYVLLHAYTSSPVALGHIRKLVADEFPDADILAPPLPAGMFSLADPVVIVCDLLKKIDGRWNERQQRADRCQYEKIVLLGHSLGALLARKLYVFACGENDKAPFEPQAGTQPQREWADRVERVILLAGMNRGWSISHHMSLVRTILWWLGTVLGNLIFLFTQRPLLIFTIRRGAPFITQLRIQWLIMRQRAAVKGVGRAMTIQLLGSIDDMVSPEDNIDLVSGRDFVYLDVPQSGHANVVEMDHTGAGQARRTVFIQALTLSKEELREYEVQPEDTAFPPGREDVTDVVFVIHGIRDLGYWTHKIARRAKALAKKTPLVVETETSGYGYFPMLSFLLPSRRRAKVDWLMDQYAEDMALYPNADFSFVGHSNGTYLLAKALREYPCCHFKHVVFAGSIVRTDYNWSEFLQSGRVKAVLNYVATRDWVVALFPKALQILGLQDLGSAGHDGFEADSSSSSPYQIKYVVGGHSAALNEDNWDAVARFVLHGLPEKPPPHIFVAQQPEVLVLAGRLAPFVWFGVFVSLAAIGYWIVARSSWAEWQRTVVFMIYLWGVLKVLTKL